MAGILTNGFKLSYKVGEGDTYTDLKNLLGVPELGGTKDKIEITTLDSTAHEYIDGIENYGDSINFEFLYEEAQFETLMNLEGIVSWKATLSDEGKTSCSFTGECSVKLNSSSFNDTYKYTLSITPNSAMEWA